MPSGPRIIINDGERVFHAEQGIPLLFSAMAEKIFIPSACGGRASCGQCRVRVLSGAPAHVPEERAILGAEEISRGVHLACQLLGVRPPAIEDHEYADNPGQHRHGYCQKSSASAGGAAGGNGDRLSGVHRFLQVRAASPGRHS
jgi:ferredoxin